MDATPVQSSVASQHTGCTMSQKLAYTVNEWLEKSGDSRATFYRAVNEGRLKVRKNGRKTLILAEDGAAYLNGLPLYQPRSAA